VHTELAEVLQLYGELELARVFVVHGKRVGMELHL